MPNMAAHPHGAESNGKARSGRRGRRRGVEIRPGTVKQARLEAGLSLGQVARGDISRTAIYFVETGKAKPSMETLRLIADRTGRPIDYFLSEPSSAPIAEDEFARLEAMLARGDNVGAAARSEHLLGQHVDAESAARIKLIAALAYLRLAQPAPGRRYASAARAYFEGRGDDLMTAEALGTEAQAAYLTRDPSALAIAEAAIEKLHSVQPYPASTAARLQMILGGVFLNEGRWEEAIQTYEQSIAAEDVVQDLHRLSLVYSGISIAHKESGHIHEATRYAQKAMTIHETLNDRLSLARSLNNLGYLLVGVHEYASARRHIERAIAIFDEEGIETQKANFILSLCEVELAQDNLEEAERLAREAAELAGQLGERTTEAEAHVWLGKVAVERRDDVQADAEFTKAISIAESVGSGVRLIQLHEVYADVLEARGDLAAANSHLRRALAATQPARKREGFASIATA